MLAREIHDVAGEIDSVSPAATDPGILVFHTIDPPLLTTKNCDVKMKFSFPYMHVCVCKTGNSFRSACKISCTCLQENVFEDSLELSGPMEHSGMTGSNGQPVELRPRGPAAGGKSTRSIRRQTWNREEVRLAG